MSVETSYSLQVDKTAFTYQYSSLEAKIVSGDPGKPEIPADRVSLREQNGTLVTYSQSLTLETGSVDPYAKLRDMVAGLLKEQGVNTVVTIDGQDVDLTALTPEKAQELVADDGYFGVEKTADRIFQFAVGIAGGDTSRIDAIREGIDRGFEQARQAFGGVLPDISYDTYDAVMKKLDDWVNQDAPVTA